MYEEITKKYLQKQENLGVEEPLLKLIEWRTYISFFGIVLTPEDKKNINKMATQIYEKLSPNDEQLLLSWINKTHVLDEENCSEILDQTTTDIVFAKALIHPKIIFEAKQNNLKNQTEERDWLVFLSSPANLISVQVPHDIDTRFFELRVLKECDTQSLYKNLWFETINNARDLVQLFVWIGDEESPVLFVNNKQWDRLKCQNYSLKQFMTDFEIGKKALAYSPTIVAASFFMYVENGFNPKTVNIRGRQV